MFTGIIQSVGRIKHIAPFSHVDYAGLQLTVQTSAAFMQGVGLGDSIAIQGACMTVTRLISQATSELTSKVTGFAADVSHESLSKTTGLSELGAVNLEKALSLSTPLGGHLVTGHVDGLGRVASIKAVGESWQLVITAPLNMARFFAIKGSAVVNGVSLTVNTVVDHETGCDLAFNLIPHTWQNTTLCDLTVGGQVNLEIDLVARYLERMLAVSSNNYRYAETGVQQQAQQAVLAGNNNGNSNSSNSSTTTNAANNPQQMG
jgi:riboflavin synthase